MPTCPHCGSYATYGDGWSDCTNCEGGPRELPEEFEIEDDEEDEDDVPSVHRADT